jgi:hypothetical protein
MLKLNHRFTQICGILCTGELQHKIIPELLALLSQKVDGKEGEEKPMLGDAVTADVCLKLMWEHIFFLPQICCCFCCS